jgi:3-methyladenine DNA glycosylase AlkC
VQKLKSAYPSFDETRFVEDIFCPEWEELVLSKRIRHSATVLSQYLPDDYGQAIDILIGILPEFPDATWKSSEPTTWIFPDYVALCGLDDLDTSEKAMLAITQYASCEVVARHFIEKYGQEMIGRMMAWADSEFDHVRRLASESTRISVPWGIKLKSINDAPATLIPLLNKLMDDPSEDVRRSVANNLNEMSKVDKRLMLDFCKKWIGKSKETDKIIKHASRSLLKHGDAEAMAMFGMEKPVGISIENFICDKSVEIGESLVFSFTIKNRSENPPKHRIGYALGLPGANGKTNVKKVRISERSCPPGNTVIERKHPMTNTSTRTLRPGDGRVGVTINGEAMAEAEFVLK